MENRNEKKGRPSLDKGSKKVPTKVWMTGDDYEKLKGRAKKAGHSYSQYCEKILLTKTPIFYGEDHKQLIAEINKIGVNFNQMVKALNELAPSRGVSKEKMQLVANRGLEILRDIRQLINTRKT